MDYFKTTERYDNIECIKLYNKYYYISLFGLYQITNNATYSHLLMSHARNKIVTGRIEDIDITDVDKLIEQTPNWKHCFRFFVGTGGLKEVR